ncbi:MAG: hypothetical protein ACI9YH_000022 [Colwellia sp.]
MKNIKEQSNNNLNYKSTLSRRESLKWLAALSASVLLPTISGCDTLSDSSTLLAKNNQGHWPKLTLSPISAKGYSKDPNMVIPPRSPWPKTLTNTQLNLVAVLADIIVPREGDVPSASQVKVPDVIDEWVSAPYQRQQQNRLTILSMLLWLDDEAQLRFTKDFIYLSNQEQLLIMDDIAYSLPELKGEFVQISNAFSVFRNLVLAAFFCSPEGTKDLGYLGNVAIMGDYPGPTEAAMNHLNTVLNELGLSS